MKLAAIYNVWDGVELMRGSVNCLRDHVDLFIIVWQKQSNYGEFYDPLEEIQNAMKVISYEKVVYIEYMPDINIDGGRNELTKRSIGLKLAKQYKCTHFINMDCDEYYTDFGAAKQEYLESTADGSVCRILTYFKSPCFRLSFPDNYLVPFIHKIYDHTEMNSMNYPFYVDPTRRVNTSSVVQLNTMMHHFSYVRKDIERKCRNSSAKHNIAKSKLLKDYYSPVLAGNPEGYFLADYNQKLTVVDNIFGIDI